MRVAASLPAVPVVPVVPALLAALAALAVLAVLAVHSWGCATMGDGTIEILDPADPAGAGPAGAGPAGPARPPRREVNVDVRVVSEAKPGAAAPCGAQPELKRGGVPVDATLVAELELTTTRPESMQAFEDTAKLHALQRCANGVSLLRATDAEGRGYVSVTVALWFRAETPTP